MDLVIDDVLFPFQVFQPESNVFLNHLTYYLVVGVLENHSRSLSDGKEFIVVL